MESGGNLFEFMFVDTICIGKKWMKSPNGKFDYDYYSSDTVTGPRQLAYAGAAPQWLKASAWPLHWVLNLLM